MSSIQFLICEVEEATDVLLEMMKDVYQRREIDTDIESSLDNLMVSLKDNLYVCIEYPANLPPVYKGLYFP